MDKKNYKLADSVKYKYAILPTKPGKRYYTTFKREDGKEYYLHDLGHASNSYGVLLSKILKKTEAEFRDMGITLDSNLKSKNAALLFREHFLDGLK